VRHLRGGRLGGDEREGRREPPGGEGGTASQRASWRASGSPHANPAAIASRTIGSRQAAALSNWPMRSIRLAANAGARRGTKEANAPRITAWKARWSSGRGRGGGSAWPKPSRS